MKSVENYVFASTLMLRTPAFNYHRHNSEQFENCLENLWMRAALQLASDSLYGELEKKAFDINALNQRSKIAVRKYYNRMCLRPTPFGLCAGISTLNWGTGNQGIQIGTQQQTIHGLHSFQHLLKNAKVASINIATNGSIYPVGKAYRYLRYEYDRDHSKRHFFINSTTRNRQLDLILNYCRTGGTTTQFIDFITAKFGITKKEAEEHRTKFLQNQLLICNSLPKITGGDRPIRLTLQTLQKRLKSGSGSNYINCERTNITGVLDNTLQQKISNALDCLNRLSPYVSTGTIVPFALKFKDRYGTASVSLMQALDPEIGIGYRSLESSMESPALLKNINWPERQTQTNICGWQAAHTFLLQRWLNVRGKEAYYDVLTITREDLNQLPLNSQQWALPPSISVLFRVTDGKVFIEEAGGATATALIGRFTLFNEQIANAATEIASAEQAANPDVLFAEIVHVSDSHTANIDRRKLVHQCEIPVLTDSCANPESQIALSDLFLKIDGSDLILFSQQHGKRVIPRLSSAFNYHNSQLAVYRFLCDLQSDKLKTNFGFHLKNIFPGLDFYPRLEFESVIIQLASWQVKKEVIDHILSAGNFEEQSGRLTELALNLHWPRFIAINEHDNQLVFDINLQWDIAFLCGILKKGQALYVTEFPFAQDKKPLVIDKKGKPYIGQFVASLYHKHPIYKPYNCERATVKPARKIQRHFLPGSEWLYFKIYCHPTRANDLLINQLYPYIKQLQCVRNWFYIRYADPEHHLRIRINLAPAHLATVTASLEKKIAKLINEGLVKDYKLAIYERELDRYNPELIQDIELAFGASSELAIQHLLEGTEEQSEYHYFQTGFNDIHCLLDIFKLSLQQRITLFEQLYLQQFIPYHPDGSFYKQLNLKYREVAGFIKERQPPVASVNFVDAHNTLAHKAGYATAIDLLTDLIHMHLNRFLSQETQKQEAVFYYFLWKYYVSKQAQNQ